MDVRVFVDKELLDELYKLLPETKKMTYTGLVDYALRLLKKQLAKGGEKNE